MQVPGKKIFYGEKFYTDWMPRGGDGFIIRGQMIDAGGDASPSLTVTIGVQTKNSEDTTNPATGVSLVDLALSTGNTVKEALFQPAADPNGVKELVRLEVTAGSGSENEWMLCRTFPLIWFEGAQ